MLCDFGSDNRIEKDVERCPENYRGGTKIEIETFWPWRSPRRIVLVPQRMKKFPGEVKILREFSGKLPYIPENSPRRILATVVIVGSVRV